MDVSSYVSLALEHSLLYVQNMKRLREAECAIECKTYRANKMSNKVEIKLIELHLNLSLSFNTDELFASSCIMRQDAMITLY